VKAIIGFDLTSDDELNKFVVCYVTTEPGQRMPVIVKFLNTRGVDESRVRRALELGIQHGTLELCIDMGVRLAVRSQQWS
jgi:hypothetical protein